MNKVKLQVFFILLALFNSLYSFFFPWSLRYLLLRATGSRVGRLSCIQNSRFFGFGKIKVGCNSIINSGCYLDNRRGITIGDNVIIAHNTKIYTLGHDINDPGFKTVGKPVTICDYVVVFSNAMIMPGVVLNKGSVVLPGSVVTKSVEEMTVVGGNPAVPIRKRERLHTEKGSFRYWFSI